ncbi:type I toxin-antitoxin system Fst family toxin [Listeria monocytogenes]|nr:type I toxin-antitoxin system Fst family toxin [Listeria monocytogenes]EAC7084034.1 type I toxin-antitoxin system Fst family toxin [Listeria monocytogenes]EAD8590525.1 type I toxin-antitoxin system Fst family toxin [Listeria monocytogenes]EAD8593647.1 type I toxin-antitoxin system Fst family toxin [Listeria monocytogenes]EAD8602652.1 type I toxin-antitoxin system Fst family toxin [Listeria monocytogenes]TYV31002.1 type I toxin-antitoxin system Fst family toxin [Listeria monocytogenes]
MSILFSSIIAPIVVGCAIALFKHVLEARRDNN